MFHYQAQTDIIGYAIRKSQWLRILREFPNFKVQVKQKLFAFYMTQIYQPLKEQRLADIEFYKRRKDYVQLYSVQDFDKEELLTLLDNIFIENSKFRMRN